MQRPTADATVTEISDAAVKKSLGLDGLSGDALKTHKNYVSFRSWEDIGKVSAWSKLKLSPRQVWENVGLGNVRGRDQLNEALSTKPFSDYPSYMNSIDNEAIANWRATGKLSGWYEIHARRGECQGDALGRKE